MKDKRLVWVSGLLLLAFVFMFINLESSISLESEKGVKEAAMQFYSALNTMFKGDVSPMIEVWSHAPDVTYLGPQGGTLVGWDQVGKAWEEQAALKLGGQVKPEDMHITAGDKIAITQNYERGTSYVDGKPVTVDIRATNIFRLEEGKWKMISHHTDIIPSLEKAVENK
jgi:ketosteroid isomerase-like protein